MPSEVQEMCTGPEFVVGEIYGLRQWHFQPATYSYYTRSLNPHFFLGDPFRLFGHHSYEWGKSKFFPNGHVMTCDAGYTEEDRVLRLRPGMFSRDKIDSRTSLTEHAVETLVTLLVDQLNIAEHVVVHRGAEKNPSVILADISWRDRAQYAKLPHHLAVFDAVRTFINDFGLDLKSYLINAPLSEVRAALIHSGKQRMMKFVSRGSGSWSCSMLYASDLWDEVDISITVDYPYPREHMRDDVLDPLCTCGFYAYTTGEALMQNSIRNTYEDFNSAVANRSVASVFGVVKGFGHTVVGTKGFRASRMEIVALTMPQHSNRGSSYGPMSFNKFDPTSVNQWYEPQAGAQEYTRELVQAELAQYSTSDKVYSSYSKLIADWKRGVFGSVQ